MDSSPRIAYVLGAFPTLSETFVLTEMRLLAEHGLAPRVCALRRGSLTMADDAALTLGRNALFRPHPALCLPLSLLYGLGGSAEERVRGAAAAYFAERLADNPPAHVHAHFLGAPTQVGHALARMVGASFSFACHAADVLTAPPPDALEHAAVYDAHVIIACTEYLRDHLVGVRGYPPKKIEVIHHGVDLAAMPKPAASRGRSSGPIVGFVGRLVPKKGLTALLEAVQPLVDELGLSVRIVGDGPERAKLTSLAQDLGLSAAVSFLGPRPWRDALELMREFSVLAIPSVVAPDGDTDGLPNVALEAGALAVPVVASKLAGLPELLTHEETALLVEPGDAEALRGALRRAVTDRAGAKARAKRLSQAIHASWSAQTAVARLAELIGEAVAVQSRLDLKAIEGAQA